MQSNTDLCVKLMVTNKTSVLAQTAHPISSTIASEKHIHTDKQKVQKDRQDNKGGKNPHRFPSNHPQYAYSLLSAKAVWSSDWDVKLTYLPTVQTRDPEHASVALGLKRFDLTDRLAERAGAYGMEASDEKSKVMVNSANSTSAQIFMNGKQLEEVDAFKYLGTTLTKDGKSATEIKIRLGIATSVMARLNKIWKSKTISFPTKVKLYKGLVLSILLCGCESWTMTAETTAITH